MCVRVHLGGVLFNQLHTVWDKSADMYFREYSSGRKKKKEKKKKKKNSRVNDISKHSKRMISHK